MKKLNQQFKKVEKTMSKLATWISLNLTYLVGIGLTSIVGKVVNKQFLSGKNSPPSWTTADYQTNLEKMF